jgi:ABC-type dipeptide/oligopeptide/nickel transport system ATPase component
MTELENKIAIEMSASAEETLQRLERCLIENGKLMIIGLGGTGKTNTAMHIVHYLMSKAEYKDGKIIIRLGDSANVWKLKFDRIPYVDITKKPSIPDNEGTLLLDLGYLSNAKNVALLENLVKQDYYIQRELMDKNNGQTPIKRIYVFEEIQNLFGSYKRSDFWLKIWSESRNYGQYFIGLAQRLSDVSTKIVERTKYMLIGSLSGDNDLGKVRRMFGKETGERVINIVMTLKRGEFLLIDKDNTDNSLKIYFPKFEQNGKPYEYDNKGNGHIRAERVFV